jgi:hypothetical protein
VNAGTEELFRGSQKIIKTSNCWLELVTQAIEDGTLSNQPFRELFSGDSMPPVVNVQKNYQYCIRS